MNFALGNDGDSGTINDPSSSANHGGWPPLINTLFCTRQHFPAEVWRNTYSSNRGAGKKRSAV